MYGLKRKGLVGASFFTAIWLSGCITVSPQSERGKTIVKKINVMGQLQSHKKPTMLIPGVSTGQEMDIDQAGTGASYNLPEVTQQRSYAPITTKHLP